MKTLNSLTSLQIQDVLQHLPGNITEKLRSSNVVSSYGGWYSVQNCLHNASRNGIAPTSEVLQHLLSAADILRLTGKPNFAREYIELHEEWVDIILQGFETLKRMIYMYTVDHIFFMPQLIELHELGYCVPISDTMDRGQRRGRMVKYIYRDDGWGLGAFSDTCIRMVRPKLVEMDLRISLMG